MPTIRIRRNPNFKTFWNVLNMSTNSMSEVEGRATAVKIATRMAVRIGERKFVEETKRGYVFRSVKVI